MKKYLDLKQVIGQEVSENRSPNNRGRLVSVGERYCLFQPVGLEYGRNDRYRVPTEYAWNAFFF